MPNKTMILGAGIAGISAGYHLKQKGQNSVIFEKDADWGGLCGYFTIDGFRFDRFVHFTFAPDDYTQQLFAKSGKLIEHTPFPSNYYQGYWLKHPAQNNLSPLKTAEKVKIITDFVDRPQKDISEIKNYDEWLRCQYGNYFAEHFPFAYTRKYWGVEAKELETKWVGVRMSSPSLADVLTGAFEKQDKCFYYAKVMRYPAQGGFRSILNYCREGLDIRLNKKVTRISPLEKTIYFADGTAETYERLISTLPLPELVKIVDNCPKEVKTAAENLHWTCGYQVSLGFNKPDIAKHLWFYIYDEDIWPARVYSPNLKSPDNAPAGCSSLQAEVFFDCKAEIPPAQKVLAETVTKLKQVCGFTDSDIVVKDIRFEPYANVTFTHGIYENRKIVRNWLSTQHIETIGRFGKWDYLWTYQAFATGKDIA